MFVVCTCVVHKRCHKDVVHQCPGEKQDSQDVISNEGKVLTRICIYIWYDCYELIVIMLDIFHCIQTLQILMILFCLISDM